MTIDAIMFEQRQEAETQARLAAYKRNWLYYNGDQKRSLPVKVNQPDDNVRLNLSRLIVDKGAAFLFGRPLKYELKEGGDRTPEEAYLDTVWQRNRRATFLVKLATSGGIYGHVFVKVVPDGVERNIPRVVSLEPENVTVFWDGDDIDSVWRYRIEYAAMGRDGKAVSKRQDITRVGDGWTIENRVARGNGTYQPDPDNPDPDWPYPFAPVVDAQNLPLPGAYYGASDMEDAGLQDAVNYVASKIQRILRYHAQPKTIGKGFGGGDITEAEDEMLILPGVDSDLFNLEMQSDLGAAQTFLDSLINWQLTLASVPNLDPAKVNVGALSGFALQILYGPLLEKTEWKRRTYGDLLVELHRRLLVIGGYADNQITTIHWQSPLPEDPAAAKESDAFELDYALASKETVRARRGLDNETETTRIDAEREAEDVATGNVGALLMRGWERGGVGANNGQPGAQAPANGRQA